MRLLGEINCNVDDKGRVKMPVLFTKQFDPADNGRLMIARDIEDCLVIYTLAGWQKQEERLLQLDPYDLEHRQFATSLMAGLSEIELDSADRFLISKQLMRHLGNAKEVVLKGLFDKIQIWDVQKYEQYIANGQANMSNLAAKANQHLKSLKTGG